MENPLLCCVKIRQMNEKEIIRAYEKTLEIPGSKRKKQIIVCPIGVVGAGKTTVIKPLSKKLFLLRISTDEMRRLLKKNGDGYGSVKTLVYNLIDKYTGKGFSIAIDGDCSSKESQEKIKQLEEKHKIKAVWIHVNPPEDFIIKKLKNFKHTWLFKDATRAIENYKISKARHQNLNFPFVYSFDTSKKDLDKQIEEATFIINKA